MTSINYKDILRQEKLRMIENQLRRSSSNSSPLDYLSHHETLCLLDDSKHKLPKLRNCWYISNYISEEEEKGILKQVYSGAPKSWIRLPGRSLQYFGGIPHVDGMLQEELPPYCYHLKQRLRSSCIFNNDINHVLLNEYSPGQGIAAHHDGPLFHSKVAILTLQGSAVIEFIAPPVPKDNTTITASAASKPTASILLQPRSLLVFDEDAYNVYQHQIQGKNMDIIDESHCINMRQANINHDEQIARKTRVSLTMRIVKSVQDKTVICSDAAQREYLTRKSVFLKNISEEEV